MAALTIKSMTNQHRHRIISANWILKRIQGGKDVRLENAVIEGDLDLNKLDLPTQHIERTKQQKRFGMAENIKIVQSSIDISNSTMQGDLNFQNLNFNKYVHFEKVTFNLPALFAYSTFDEEACFDGATFCDDVWFQCVTFDKNVLFHRTTFMGFVSFAGAIFRGGTWFGHATFNGDTLSFKNADFIFPYSQEDACRRAKNVLEKNGNREEAGNHFYREMDGKRKQKPWYIRYPEWLFIQFVFGYGVHPFRLMACWFGFVFLFAAIYSLGRGIDVAASQLNENASLADYIWFSIATAVTPGYAGYKPTPDFKLVAGLEAIFGTFMWAAFIATFSRKYMR